MRGSGLKKTINKNHIGRKTKNVTANKVLPVVKKQAVKMARQEIKNLFTDTDDTAAKGGKIHHKKAVHSVSKAAKKNHVARKALNTAKTHVLPVARTFKVLL